MILSVDLDRISRRSRPVRRRLEQSGRLLQSHHRPPVDGRAVQAEKAVRRRERLFGEITPAQFATDWSSLGDCSSLTVALTIGRRLIAARLV
jgi:hypothetical protein